MQTKNIRPNQAYGLTNPLFAAAQSPVIVGRAPTPNDNAFLGTLWINPVTGIAYVLTQTIANQSTWVVTGSDTAFKVLTPVNIPAVTGDGTIAYVPFTLIGGYDLGNNIDTAANTFTVPTTGVYHFDASVGVNNLAAGHTTGYIQIGALEGPYMNPIATAYGGINASSICFSTDIYLTATTVLSLSVVVGGGALAVGIVAAGTYFNGRLCN